MILAFKKLSLVGRFKASTQMSMFCHTECEDAMRIEVWVESTDIHREN